MTVRIECVLDKKKSLLSTNLFSDTKLDHTFVGKLMRRSNVTKIHFVVSNCYNDVIIVVQLHTHSSSEVDRYCPCAHTLLSAAQICFFQNTF